MGWGKKFRKKVRGLKKLGGKVVGFQAGMLTGGVVPAKTLRIGQASGLGYAIGGQVAQSIAGATAPMIIPSKGANMSVPGTYNPVDEAARIRHASLSRTTTSVKQHQAIIADRRYRPRKPKGSDLPWWTPAGIAQRLTGLGQGAVKTEEEQRRDPRTPFQQLWAKVEETAGGAGKWLVVGLVATAAIVVIPRILPKA